MIAILGILLGIACIRIAVVTVERNALRAAADPDTDIFATLLARGWSIEARAGIGHVVWHIGSESGKTPQEVWKRANAVWCARHEAL